MGFGFWSFLPAVSEPLENCRRNAIIIGTAVNDPGKMLFIFGLIIAAVGLLIWTGFGKGWLGRLPGDIHYTKGNFSFYFPIVTCLLLSAILTFLLWLFRK